MAAIPEASLQIKAALSEVLCEINGISELKKEQQRVHFPTPWLLLKATLLVGTHENDVRCFDALMATDWLKESVCQSE